MHRAAHADRDQPVHLPYMSIRVCGWDLGVVVWGVGATVERFCGSKNQIRFINIHANKKWKNISAR